MKYAVASCAGEGHAAQECFASPMSVMQGRDGVFVLGKGCLSEVVLVLTPLPLPILLPSCSADATSCLRLPVELFFRPRDIAKRVGAELATR